MCYVREIVGPGWGAKWHSTASLLSPIKSCSLPRLSSAAGELMGVISLSAWEHLDYLGLFHWSIKELRHNGHGIYQWPTFEAGASKSSDLWLRQLFPDP